MRKMNKKILISFLAGLGVFVALTCMTKAWAGVAFIQPNKVNPGQYDVSVKDQIPQTFAKEAKSRAPEPTTMALFGSGLLSMIISFVRKTYHIAKRSVDIIGSVAGLIFSFPLCLLAIVLIKLTSKGPILFKQERVGKDGELFMMYKFRTMRVDAEKLTGPVWASKNDSRITPVGNFLRKTRIDEIPQFINVIKGEMSIIGPRPERPFFVNQLRSQISDYEKRLSVKPGITGLAQVLHRYDETLQDVRKKVKYDIHYIKNVCLWTDLQIVLRTFRVVLTGQGAR